MNDFRRPHGSRPRFGAPSSARPRARFGGARPRQEDAQLFDAVCSTCGRKCQVPFRPSNARPVYCKDCFGAPHDALQRKANSSGAAGEGKSTADLTRQVAAMNAKVDAILKILQDATSEE